ncbi:MAG TPA: toluene-4-monooxygenase system B family protein [Polyangia bacterium]|nr:toluene-4-monooxygenase system B family protein [Polyangia bacterium]
MIPLYGFLEGDTLGLLVLAREDQTLASLARALQDAGALRVAPADGARVWVRGEALESSSTVAAAGLQPLDRFDVRFGSELGGRGPR